MIEAKLTLIMLLDKYEIVRNKSVPIKYNYGLMRGFENQNLVFLKKKSSEEKWLDKNNPKY